PLSRTDTHKVTKAAKSARTTKITRGTHGNRRRPFVSFVLSFVSFVAAAVMFAGCRPGMHDQPKYPPLPEPAFFREQRPARPLVEGTVARGHLRDDALLYTGRAGKTDATTFPFPIDARVMARGQERFDIFCSPCHGRTGQGDGMIVRRGYRRPPTYHQDRL